MNTFLSIVAFSLASVTSMANQEVLASEIDTLNQQNWYSFGANIPVNIQNGLSNTPQFYSLRFLLNGNDVSALVVKLSASKFMLIQDHIKHPEGQHVLEVFAETTEQVPLLLHTQAVNILSPLGFKQSDLTIEGSLTFSAQKNIETQQETALTDSTIDKIERKKSQSQIDLQVSLSSKHTYDETHITSHTNIVGTSAQQNALQFSQAQENADKIDLSDYLVSASTGTLQLQVGHQYVGANPLLFDNIANRGLHIGYQFNRYMDIALHQQNGSDIVGWENIVGQQNSQHRMRSAIVSTEIFPEEQGKLQFELTYLNASTFAIDVFAVGEVSNIQKSQGWGLELKGHFLEESLVYQARYARSTFEHPLDSELAFTNTQDALALNIVPTKAQTSEAYFAQIDYALWPNTTQDISFFSAALSLQHERFDALYKSIGANTPADYRKSSLTLNGTISKGNWNYNYLTFRNNVDNIPSILTTQTRSHNFVYSVSLADEFDILTNGANSDLDSDVENEEKDTSSAYPFLRSLLPNIHLQMQHTHQYALNNPSEIISDFNSESHLPDQVSELVDLSFDWEFDAYNIAYAISYAFQDNKQLGRQNADFAILNHIIRQQFQLSQRVSLNLELARARNADIELGQALYQNNAVMDINVSLFDNWALNLNASKNRDYDNLASSLQKAFTLGFNLQYQWQSTLYSQSYSGNWHLRFAKQQNAFVDNQFNLNSRLQNWHIHTGLHLSF